MKHLIENLKKRQNLSGSEMETAIKSIINGETDDDIIKQLLVALHEKGETTDEIIATVNVLRHHMDPIDAPPNAVDCCGTGGDGANTLNISTAVALVAASCGIPVAKHGNRASTSKSGAADVLEALGLNLNSPKTQLEKALSETGFAFLMAPNHHPAMGRVKHIRRTIPHRTIFNLTGPLLNPAATKRQLIGVYER